MLSAQGIGAVFRRESQRSVFPSLVAQTYQLDSMHAEGEQVVVSKLRITAGLLQPRVKATAKSSSNVEFIPPPNKKGMAGMVTYLQALKCLQEGQIVGKPRKNQHGDWEFQMERYAANQLARFNVVASVDGARVTRLYVLLEN